MSKPKNNKRRVPIAKTVDRYALYLASVQAPDHEVKFFNRVYKAVFNKSPRVLREDFCGTFAVCCEWVKNQPDRLAVGVDIDPEPLKWGREHNLTGIKPAAQQRVKLMQADVRDVKGPKADVLAAQNFSFWYFKTRPELLRYLKAAYRNMADKGIMILDMMGGSEVIEEDHMDVTEYDDFDYEWEQERFDPITHHCRFHIHFKFKDGSRLKRAFTYDWRLWTIPEVSELLEEAGFDRVDVYWEGTDSKTDEGNGVFTRRTSAPADDAWVSYMVAVKK